MKSILCGLNNQVYIARQEDRPTNLAHEFAKAGGRTIEQCRGDYDGACIEFAGDFIDHLSRGRLAYFETPRNPVWKYHAAVELDGMIHDLWQGAFAMPLSAFMEMIGADSVEYPAEQEEE